MDHTWLHQLDSQQQALITTSKDLLEISKKSTQTLNDYSYIVFPAAKAYEGLLKDCLQRINLIDERVYLNPKFRIGRSLNPDLAPKYQDEWWFYDDFQKHCGEELARDMWQSWIECRNHLFHFYKLKYYPITISQAEIKLDQLLSVMRQLTLCFLTK